MAYQPHDYGVSEDYAPCLLCGTLRPKTNMELAPDGRAYECADEDWCKREQRTRALRSKTPPSAPNPARSPPRRAKK